VTYIFVLRGGILTKLGTDIHHVSGFQGQKVKVICVQTCECCDGGGVHFESMASRL